VLRVCGPFSSELRQLYRLVATLQSNLSDVPLAALTKLETGTWSETGVPTPGQ